MWFFDFLFGRKRPKVPLTKRLVLQPPKVLTQPDEADELIKRALSSLVRLIPEYPPDAPRLITAPSKGLELPGATRIEVPTVVTDWPGRLRQEEYDDVDDDLDEDDLKELTTDRFHGPLDEIPKNRKQAYSVYGDPGVGTPDKVFQRKNLVIAEGLPGSWNGDKKRLYCHRLAEPYIREALRRAELLAPGYIKRLGCYNFRHIRHDTSRPLSYHSWAIALDINPKQNRSRNRKRDKVPQPFEGNWQELWPEGISLQVAKAFCAVGWTWGGDWRSYIDPMHFQLVG